MATKDQVVKEEIDRTKDKGNTQATPAEKQENKSGKTEVKNANAAGMGTMGRNDEAEGGAPKEESDGKY